MDDQHTTARRLENITRLCQSYQLVNQRKCVVIPDDPCRCLSKGLLVLFEPKRDLTRRKKYWLAGLIAKKIKQAGMPACRVIGVPRGWMIDHSDPKRRCVENYEKYLFCKDQQFYIVGDSHVRLLWTEEKSYVSEWENVHVMWRGSVYSGECFGHADEIRPLIKTLRPNDIFLWQGGEPEIRSIFMLSKRPMARIAKSVLFYETFLKWIRSQWNGRIGFMTGAPTNGVIHGPTEKPKNAYAPIIGSPKRRYYFQKIFYNKMKKMCQAHGFYFVDACSPFLKNSPRIPNKYRDMRSTVHLKRKYSVWYFDWLDQMFGFVSQTRRTGKNLSKPWDGSYAHYSYLMREWLNKNFNGHCQIDYHGLVSTGLLTEETLPRVHRYLKNKFKLPRSQDMLPSKDCEDIDQLYEKYVFHKSPHSRDQLLPPHLRKKRMSYLERLEMNAS